MYSSLGSAVLAALCLLPSTSAALKTVPNGPNKLDECPACPRMYTALVQCQKIEQPDGSWAKVNDCICVPGNDGWYPYLDACRECLATGTDDFFGNMGRLMTQLYGACRDGPSGNITSNGLSLCVGSGDYESCISLKDASHGDSWASFRGLTEKYQVLPSSNRTQTLNLAALEEEETPSTASASTTKPPASSRTSETASATGTSGEAPSDTAASQTGTTAAATAAATESPSSAARMSYESRAGCIFGISIAAGIVGLLA
ncbi:uncharacterized protein P884DRAFT_86546 [Thermothelomyces heterothallicus CBS 202.75]|uniref:uncharacterized protein n=1 Tax=Thermothelomyces heterothallicus CBS 202.75 TaxID=1149848 RepID=UPI003742184F